MRPPSPHRSDDALRVEPVVSTPELLRTVIDVLVRYAEHLNVDARASFRKELRHR